MPITKNRFIELVTQLSTSVIEGDELNNILTELQNDFIEKENELFKLYKKYGEEDNSYTFELIDNKDAINYKDKYENLKSEYTARFFNNSKKDDVQTVLKDDELKNDIEENISFDDLFTRKEN